MTTTAVSTATAYVFTVVEGEYTFTYEWGKTPPEGQNTSEYLQSCKREAELLAQWDIDQKAPPTELVL